MKTSHRDTVIATCIRALPNEGCGLLVGSVRGADATVSEVVASENVASSARVYEIDPLVLLRTVRRVESEGRSVLGVFHSHTHSAAYPSPTDVEQSPDPAWHYVIVSLRDVPTDVRSFRVVDGTVDEEVLYIDERGEPVRHGGSRR